MPDDRPPDFTRPPLADAPAACFAPAPADGVLPEGVFTTTNLPTEVKVNGRARRPVEAPARRARSPYPFLPIP